MIIFHATLVIYIRVFVLEVEAFPGGTAHKPKGWVAIVFRPRCRIEVRPG